MDLDLDMPTSATTSPCPAIRDIMALEMGPAFRARWATLRLTHSRARVVELLRRGSVGQITADWNLRVLREDLLLQSFRCRLGWSHAGVACMSVAAIGLTKMALRGNTPLPRAERERLARARQPRKGAITTSPGNVIERALEQLPLRHRRRGRGLLKDYIKQPYIII